MKLINFTRAVSNMAGVFSQDLVEKAQEAIRILASIPLPTLSSASQDPTTSSGETKSCVFVYCKCIPHVSSHLHSKTKT